MRARLAAPVYKPHDGRSGARIVRPDPAPRVQAAGVQVRDRRTVRAQSLGVLVDPDAADRAQVERNVLVGVERTGNRRYSGDQSELVVTPALASLVPYG